MKRRDVLKVLLAAPAATFTWSDAEAAQAAASAQAARAAATAKPFVPKFFTATEFNLVRTLADIVIPKDERSGSATDAGVPEFIDFIMVDQPGAQTQVRGGVGMATGRGRAPARPAPPPRLGRPRPRPCAPRWRARGRRPGPPPR